MVVLRADEHGDKRLVGYIVPAAGAVISAHELRTHLAATLPEYMVVSSFVPLDAFPDDVEREDRPEVPARTQSVRRSGPEAGAGPSLDPGSISRRSGRSCWA